MATPLKLKPIFSSLTIITLFFFFIIMSHYSQIALSLHYGNVNEEDGVHVLDHPVPDPSRSSRSNKFLISVIREGSYCSAAAGYNKKKNICDWVSADHGKAMLNCCRMSCRNILSDMNNCGDCGHKCRFGELCCNGSCTNAFNNKDNCGLCNRKCPHGVKCEFGNCGYA